MRSRGTFGKIVLVLTAIALLAVWQVAPAMAQEKAAPPAKAAPAKAMAPKVMMSKFLVISPHTPDQCLAALDAVEAMPGGAKEMAKWDWGCMGGDHTGYLIVSAASADDALKHVPDSVRGQAKAIKLNKFTEKQIKSFHEAKK